MNYSELIRFNETFKNLVGEDSRLEFIKSGSTDRTELYLITKVNMDYRDYLVNPTQKVDVIYNTLDNLKQTVLKQKLFNEEARKLKHYEELKTMKFALDALEKLVPVARQKLGVDKLTDL